EQRSHDYFELHANGGAASSAVAALRQLSCRSRTLPEVGVPLDASVKEANVTSPRPTLRGHLAIARIDHWFKNVFVVPGIVVALGTDPLVDRSVLAWRVVVGLLAVCLIASSNYTLNELVDAPYDRHHPTKHTRPVPAGQVSVPLGYVQWLVPLLRRPPLRGRASVPC